MTAHPVFATINDDKVKVHRKGFRMPHEPRVAICKDVYQEVHRLEDKDGFNVHFNGGLIAHEISKDRWTIEPVQLNGCACAVGFFSRSNLFVFMRQNGFAPIAFESIGWVKGEFYSMWVPIIPGRENHSISPANLWGNIASNSAKARLPAITSSSSAIDKGKFLELLDDRTPIESLARSISVSLRCMDISISQIIQYYAENLTNNLAAGRTNGEKRGTTLDQTLYAHIHAFFLHFGATRDYVGALIAVQLGLDYSKVDSMAKVVNHINASNFSANSLIQTLAKGGNISPNAKAAGSWITSGWLKRATDLRNQFVHNRPYGHIRSERAGWTNTISVESGIYRYFRPIEIEGSSTHDVLDEIRQHYIETNRLLLDMATESGYDFNTPNVVAKDLTIVDRA